MSVFANLKAMWLGPAPAAPPPAPPPMVPDAIAEAAKFIACFEAFRSHPYLPTPRDRPTIGYGTTVYPSGRPVAMSDPPCTADQALEWLEARIRSDDAALHKACSKPLNTHEEAALLSLAYNIGDDALAKSTLMRNLNAGDVQGAADQFLVWNKQKGEALPGLTSRRKSERDIFLGRAI